MKNNLKEWRRSFLLLLGVLIFSVSFAQTGDKVTITGNVVDDAGEPIIGASIVEKGTTNGVSSDLDGHFIINVQPNATIVASFIGFNTQEFLVKGKTNISIVLNENAKLLSEVVVIGYGSVKKEDVTGSVTAIKIDEKNKGLTTSPQDMLVGKIAGVSVVTGGGEPGAGSTIRIRGAASLSAKNDPLIVVDGVIMASETVGGLSNGLSTVNPADIETFTVLKDASAAAIYGSRASNGVIIITTKKGQGGKMKISYNGNMSISTRRKKVDVLSGNEYRDLVSNLPDATPGMLDALNLYPNQSTDWQDEIFRTAVSTDHNLSLLGSIKNFSPYRVSVGYTNENGVLKTSNFERFTGNVSLTPSLFQDHLRMNLNAKGTYIKNRFANKGAVASAVFYGPTKPVKNGNTTYGGYYTWTTDNQIDGPRNTSAGTNPVSLLEMKNDKSDVKAFVGNAQFDYKLHFFPDLKVNVNMAYDYSNSDGGVYVAPNAPEGYSSNVDESGSKSHYENTYKNALFESYAQYVKDVESLKSRFDVMGGYSYQSYKQETNNVVNFLSRDSDRFGQQMGVKEDYRETAKKNVLISFYGRFNYTFMDRYLMTFTLRDDGSSRFSKDNRWSLFPSLALAWRVNEEDFLKDVDYLSNLKLRLGWGKTGQQDIDGNWYPSRQSWAPGKGGAMYPIYDDAGNVTWVNVIKPTVANPNLKWETTTTWNVGIDYGFLRNRISGTIDFYHRKTTDLINGKVELAAGTDFGVVRMDNIGSLENKGVEFSVNAVAIESKDLMWELGYNISYNKSKITQLTYNDAISNSPGFLFESFSNKRIKIHSVGYAPGSFYVFEQIYDNDGKPIEGAYVDRNGDGKIDDGDLYQHKKPEADVLMGFSSKVTYKQWDLGFNGRVSLNNYVFNALEADNGGVNVTDLFSNNNLANKTPTAVSNNFSTRQRLSDYYVQNASFLKIDNITLGYSFGRKAFNGRIFASVQNPIVITKYDGLDPEISGGVDKDFYPRPLTFILGLNLNF